MKNTKLIVMDEATSGVDMRTDELVQRAIRNEDGLFKEATVITIAHRLITVIDFDYLMVLNSGELVEFGTPYELLMKKTQDDGAWFRRMVDDMGEDARDTLMRLAKGKHEKTGKQ